MVAGKNVQSSISLYERMGDQLMRQADMALYRAKDGGRNRFCLFEAEMPHRYVGADNSPLAVLH